MLYFHSYKSPGLVVDLVGDIRRLNDMSVRARKAGMIILGGGVCKHQIANAMLFVSSERAERESAAHTWRALQRNGADYAVYINTGQEFDGSDSGARPDEAISWGKIKGTGESVKVRSARIGACNALLVRGLHGSRFFSILGVLRRDHHLPPHRGADIRQSALGCTKTAGREWRLAC